MIAKTKVIGDIRKATHSLPLVRYVDPEYVYLAVCNTRCPRADIGVKPGDKVKIGTVIGVRHAPFFDQNIHSTVSGEVVGTVKKFHRSGKLTEFVQIKNDFKETYEDTIKERTPEEIAALSREDFIEIVKENSLVGLGGSSFPTYIKFQTTDPIHTLCINGIECEPYLSSDHRIILEYPDRLMKGIGYAMKAFGAKVAYICIKKKYQDLYDALTAILGKYPELNVKIARVGNYYPQGWEIEMVKSALGIKIPSGVLPSKFGIMNFNVSTIVGLYKAIRYNMPVIKRNFTLTGDGIKFPQNFRVRVGTSVLELIDKCGGYVDDKDKVFIMGGPMMGACQVKDDAVITKTVTSVIVLQHKVYKEEPCVRCASCVYSCPCGLQPVQIMNAVKNNDREGLKKLNVKRCIECGLCSYTCTSKIHLTEYCRKGKKLV